MTSSAGPSCTRSSQINPCPYDSWWDLSRWYWYATVNGTKAHGADGYTLTKWAARLAARRWHRIDRRNRKRMATPATIVRYPATKGSQSPGGDPA
jgi:hypothetical protein